jgi:hypothetical protein
MRDMMVVGHFHHATTAGPLQATTFTQAHCPHPAHLVEPAAHRFRGYRDAMFGLERRCECGTTPPGAAPAIGPWGRFEYGTEGTREPGHQDTRSHGYRELAIGGDLYAKAPGAIRPYDPVYTGARAKQEGRNFCGGSPYRTQ